MDRRKFIATTLGATIGAATGGPTLGGGASQAAASVPVLLPQGGGLILYRDVMLPVRMNRTSPGFLAKLFGAKPKYEVVHPYLRREYPGDDIKGVGAAIIIPNPDYENAEFEVMHQQADALTGEFDPVIMPRAPFDGLSFEEAVCSRIKEEGLDCGKSPAPRYLGRFKWIKYE